MTDGAMPRRAGRQLGVVCWALAAALAAARVPEAAARTVEPVISEVSGTVTVAERFATASLQVKILARQEGWQTVPLLPSRVVLRTFDVKGRQGCIQRTPDRYVVHLMGKDDYTITLEFVLTIQERGVERTMLLPLVAATSGRIELVLNEPDQSVTLTPAAPIETSTARGRTRAVIYPSGLEAVRICWLPAEEARERAPSIEARETAMISLSGGALNRDSRFSISLRRGEVHGLIVGVPEGVDVLRLEVHEPAPSRDPVEAAWDLDGQGLQRRLHIRLAQPRTASFVVRLLCEQVISGDTVRVEPLRIEAAARRTGTIRVAAAPRLTITDAGSTGLQRAAIAHRAVRGEGRFRRTGTALAFEYHRLPFLLRLKVAPVPSRITAATAAHVRLQAGVVELLSRITYCIEDRPVRRLRIRLDDGLMVLGVTGRDIDTWNADGRGLDVRLRRPVLGQYDLTLRCLQKLRRVNGILIPQVHCLDAERQSGSLGITAASDVALVHHQSRKFVQVNVDQLPQWIMERRPKLAYLYDQPGGRLSVNTSRIRPSLRVEGYGAARVAEDAVEEEYVFICDVECRPLFGLRIQLPPGLTPINLLGSDIADWEFHAGQGTIMVAFDKAWLGRRRLHLFCERRLDADTRVVSLGGVRLPDADHAAGWFGVGTDANLDLIPISTRGVTAVDVRTAPALVSSSGGLRLAFRWARQAWGLRCEARRVSPRVAAETRTALIFAEGRMSTETDITWRVSKAKVSELLIVVPEGAVNVQVTGGNILSREPLDGKWRVRLAEPVRGELKMRVGFDQVFDPRVFDPRQGTCRYTGVRLPQAETQRGLVGVYAEDPQIEITPATFVNAVRSDERPRLRVGDFPCLGAFAYSGADRSVGFEIKGHALARGLLLQAEHCSISTVVRDQGRAVTYLNCRVRNTGAQFIRVKLPTGAQLWGAYVQGRPVRPNRAPGGEVLVPVLETPRGAAFDVGVIWSEPLGRMKLVSDLALTAPKLDLPAQDVRWEVYLPKQYEVVRTGGNMKMLRRQVWYRQGLPGVAWRYSRAAWPVVRTCLIILVCLTMLGAVVYGVIRLVAGAIAMARERGATRHRPRFALSTIVSVLVVILVILVLSGLFLPVLSRAREEARRTLSRSNLSQMEQVTADEEGGAVGVQQAARPHITVAKPEKRTQAERLKRGKLRAVARTRAMEKARKAERAEQDRRARYDHAMKMAVSNLRRGEYKAAEDYYRRALQQVPGSQRVRDKLTQLDELKKVAQAQVAETPPVSEPADIKPGKGWEEETVSGTYGLGGILTLHKSLRARSGKDLDSDIAETEREGDLLDLSTGRKERIRLPSGGEARLKNGALVVTGTRDEVQELERSVRTIRRRMIEKSRELAKAGQQQKETQAAARRATLKRRAAAIRFKVKRVGGTIRGSRAAGAMPLEISFPSFGTRAYPFKMDYAGSSQAKIEMTCVRGGTAMVFQGVIGLLPLAGLVLLCRRRPRMGAAVAALLGLVFAFLMISSGEAGKPYLVMVLVGVGLALPHVLVRCLNRRAKVWKEDVR